MPGRPETERARSLRGSGTTRVPGQKAGKFQVLVDGKPAGSLTWGSEPGP